MSATSKSSLAIVIDANVAVWAVLPKIAKVNVLDRLAEWRQREVVLMAPAHWVAECMAALRMAVYVGQLPQPEAILAIDALFALEVDVIPSDQEVCHSALRWAERLNQARAYDGFYLGLAERLGAQFWTADERLVNRARQVGADWVHWVGEGEQALP